MKKYLISLGAMLAATFSFTNCSEEIQNPADFEKSQFTIYVNPSETKTQNDGLGTDWSDGDMLNVFHAPAGSSEYSPNTRFALTDAASGKFEADQLNGNLASSNDWYVLYPYNENIISPSNKSQAEINVGAQVQVQQGNNSMAHIAGPDCPIWGVAKAVSKNEAPEISITNLTSLIRVEVTNECSESMVVESVKMTAPVDIVGAYYVDFTQDIPSFSPSGEESVSDNVLLNVSSGSPILSGEKAEFYLAVKPFTIGRGQSMTLSVNGFDKVLEMTSDALFASGKLTTFKFKYNESSEAIDITLSEETLELEVGETHQLVASISSSDAVLDNIIWTTSNESVATVSDEGSVTAVAEGEATITAQLGDITATCEVNVVASEDNYITMVYVTENNNEKVSFSYGLNGGHDMYLSYGDEYGMSYNSTSFPIDCGDGTTCNAGNHHIYKLAGEYVVKIMISEPIMEFRVLDRLKWIKSITLPSTVRKLEIQGGTNLEEVTIGSKSFTKSSYVTGVNLKRFKGPMASEDGRFLINEGELIGFAPAGQTSFSIPDDVKIPTNATGIGEKLFAGMSIVKAEIPEGITYIGDSAFSGNSTLQEISFPSTMKSIGDDVFNSCSSLGKLEFKEGLESIGSKAFNNCSSLTDVYLPNTVTSLEVGIFSGCAMLTNLHLSDAMTVIPDAAFSDCSALASVNIPTSIKEIGDRAFYGCSLNQDLIFPESLEYIGDNAFSDYDYFDESIPDAKHKISKIYLGENLYYVGTEAFATENLKTVEFHPETKLDKLYDAVFKGTSIESITIPKNIKYIARDAFMQNSLLREVNFAPDSKLISIEDGYVSSNGGTVHGAFCGCYNMTDISLPASLQSIGSYAFYGCNFSDITLPSNLMSINSYAFALCPMTTIALPENLESVAPDFADGLNSLSSFSSVSPNFVVSDDGYCLASSQGELIRFVFAAYPEEYEIPETIGSTTITSIGSYAFSERSLRRLTLHQNITSIGNYGLNGEIDYIYCTGEVPPTLSWNSGVSSDGMFVGNPSVNSLNKLHTIVYVPTSYLETYINSDWGICPIAMYGDELTVPIEAVKDKMTFSVNGVSFDMIGVEGGIFWMGAQPTDSWKPNYDPSADKSKEGPVHQVVLSSYYMGETEVTQELWYAVMETYPQSLGGDEWDEGSGKGPNYPAYYISWDEAQEFITRLNSLTGVSFSLPTEAQWEYAARGGNKSNGYLYSGSDNIDDVAWYKSNRTHGGSSEVATKSPNELGIYDMSGNLMEWCSDYEKTTYGSSLPLTNPTGPETGTVRKMRGGSWKGSATSCRVSDRSTYYAPSKKYDTHGFRLVLTAVN